MKIDITPNELKMLINDYELQIAMAKIEFYGNSHRGPIIKAGSSITEMNSRLESLKAMYEASLDNVRRFYQLKGTNGARDFCTYYEGMSMRDAAELIEEFESRKES